MTEARTVEIGPLQRLEPAAADADRRPLPARGPRPRARDRRGAGAGLRGGRHRADLQELLRQGEPHLARRRSAASGMDEGLRILAEVRERIGCPVLTDVHLPERLRRRSPRRSTCCRSRPSCRRQTDLLLAAGRDRRRDQRQEGPVPRALGHGATSRRRSPRPATSASCSASAAPPSATTRWSPTCAACRSWRGPAIRW